MLNIQYKSIYIIKKRTYKDLLGPCEL